MPSLSGIAYYLLHPQELRAMIQWKTWHDPVHTRNPDNEDVTLQKCFEFLDKTSRSFSAVIQELNPELLVPVCLFYLILRGLDTIEDDMTIDFKEKDPLLRNFHNILEEDGWTYGGNHPKEKDRDLLLHFYVVITEFKKVRPEYQEIIKDITRRMGAGMALTQSRIETQKKGGSLNTTIEDYEMYCHYVAGLVGEGLTRLFVEAKLANPALLQRSDLHESMGQFLQQTNIIRDVREDFEDGRILWPTHVWSKYVNRFEDLFSPDHLEAALQCQSEMVLLALDRADDCLFYLAGIKDQSVFNFAAIPQSMAIATLELCYRNPAMFQRNIKITRGQACQLMIDSSQNLQVLYEVFRKFARTVHKKSDPRDPNFLKISVVCGKIEQFVESVFPTQDSKAIARVNGIQPSNTTLNRTEEEMARQKAEAREAQKDVLYIVGAIFAVLCLVSGIMIMIAKAFGARFDLAIDQLRSGNLWPTKVPENDPSIHGLNHPEL